MQIDFGSLVPNTLALLTTGGCHGPVWELIRHSLSIMTASVLRPPPDPRDEHPHLTPVLLVGSAEGVLQVPLFQ